MMLRHRAYSLKPVWKSVCSIMALLAKCYIYTFAHQRFPRFDLWLEGYVNITSITCYQIGHSSVMLIFVLFKKSVHASALLCVVFHYKAKISNHLQITCGHMQKRRWNVGKVGIVRPSSSWNVNKLFCMQQPFIMHFHATKNQLSIANHLPVTDDQY